MRERVLTITMYGTTIGYITQRTPTSDPAFTYDRAYVESGGSTPLGILMPVQTTSYKGKRVRAFLESLLPEDQATRQFWGASLGVDPSDTIAILANMGWDCPGAVQFSDPDAVTDMLSQAQSVHPLTTAEIGARLRDLRTSTDPSWTLPEEHWSLPGQQPKFALARLHERWHEVRGSAASTHIIKPGIGRLHHQALVEHATMRAADDVGIEVAATEYTHFADEPAVVIERYDRIVLKDHTVLRLHQEDFCSATGNLPTKKYEAHGGPRLIDFARTIGQNATDREKALRALGDFVAINYVAGAPDGHSKNVSLMLLPGETTVAPLYDLATSFPYKGSSGLREVALGVGGRRKFGQVLGKHWDRAAQTLGIPVEEYRARVRDLAAGFPDAFSDALRAIATSEATMIRQQSVTPLARHVQHIQERLNDAPGPH